MKTNKQTRNINKNKQTNKKHMLGQVFQPVTSFETGIFLFSLGM